WYRDVPAVNSSKSIVLTLVPVSEAGTLSFSDASFYPIDGELLGDEGMLHNYGFTVEVHKIFEYRGGERLSFASEGDLWVFINKRLAVDLGGIHPPRNAEIDLDAQASSFGLVRGEGMKLDLFFANRQDTGSTLKTTLAAVSPCD